jgi:hypothetical protein
MAGPMANSDVGQALNRFAMRALDQDQTKQQEPGIISHSSILEKNMEKKPSKVGSEVQEFFSRKQQIEAITAVDNSNTDREITPVFEMKPQLIAESAPRIYEIGKSVESMNRIPLAEPSKEVSDAPLGERTQSDILKQLNETIVNDLKKQHSNSSINPVEEKTTSKTKRSKENISKDSTKTDSNTSIPVKEDDAAPVDSSEGISPVKDVIVPTEDEIITPNASSPIVNPKKVSAKNLPSLPVSNLFSRTDPAGIVRCKLVRKKNFIGKGQPTYYLYNEFDNSILLAAKRILMSKSINYIISDHADDISKDSTHYVAKLKANFMRTNFTLTDTRSVCRQREIACISYVLFFDYRVRMYYLVNCMLLLAMRKSPKMLPVVIQQIYILISKTKTKQSYCF